MSVYLDECNFDLTIKKKNIPAAFEAAKKLIQSGEYGVWDDDKENWESLEKLINATCWVAGFDKKGNLILEEAPENFNDQDIVFFNTIAPYVEVGSYIDINTSDFQHFEWYFDGNNCIRKEGKMDYDCNIEIVEALLTKQKDLPKLLGIHPELDKRIHEVLKG